jgi:beta-lactamase class D
MSARIACTAVLAVALLARGQTAPDFERVAEEAFAGRAGALVLLDAAAGTARVFRPDAAARRLPPCSTFKIWNTLIGLETGVLASPDEAFYTWDGVERSIPAWNADLTLRDAFRASCVPAFQQLARRIGRERMQTWLHAIGYGDKDMSAGVDVFWLPEPGRKTILISPREQAELMRRLVTGRLPFAPASVATLKALMELRRTERGVLYGKTGSGADAQGRWVLGWLVGFVESEGRTCAFACAVQGENVSGREARAIVETVLEQQRVL